MEYLSEAWYVAGFADELTQGKMLARTLLGEPLVFFRQTSGAIACLQDRCPHRFAPLSARRLCDGGESVECGYHGLRFDGGGSCIRNPHGDGSIPKAAKVKAYSVSERAGLIWWWAGDVSTADETLIPDYSHVTSAASDATVRGYLPANCDYQYLVDNILDLTHVDFLHFGFLGSGALTRSTPEVTDVSERVARIAWRSSGDLAPPVFDAYLRTPGAPTDQWTEVVWTAPANMLLRAGATLLGEVPESGVDSINLHLATPESASRTHYWYWSTRNFAVSPDANEIIREKIEYAFSQEDKGMLEAQQRNTGEADFWSLKPVLLPIDSGSVRVRRKLERLIASSRETRE